MKFVPITPPRVYSAGIDQKVMIKDTGRLSLLPDEQVTVKTEAGAELDVRSAQDRHRAEGIEWRPLQGWNVCEGRVDRAGFFFGQYDDDLRTDTLGVSKGRS